MEHPQPQQVVQNGRLWRARYIPLPERTAESGSAPTQSQLLVHNYTESVLSVALCTAPVQAHMRLQLHAKQLHPASPATCALAATEDGD